MVGWLIYWFRECFLSVSVSFSWPPLNCVNCEWWCIGVWYAKCSLRNCRTVTVSLQRITIPLFLNSDKDKGFLFNFRQRHEAFKNTDTRHFKIQMSNMGPQAPPSHPPHPWQGLCSRYQYFRVKRLKLTATGPKVTKIPWFRFHFSWPHPQVAPTWHIIIINIFTGWTSWHIAKISCKQQINNFASIMVIVNKYRHLHEHARSLPPSLTHPPTHPPTHSLTHSLTLFIQAGTQGQNQMTPLNPVLSFHLTCASPHVRPISSSLFITLLQQAPFAQKLDSAIHRINHYSVDRCLKNQLHHQADRDLSGR